MTAFQMRLPVSGLKLQMQPGSSIYPDPHPYLACIKEMTV